MLPRHQPDRIRIAFDDHRLVNNAGLILPATLALHLGRAPGRANTGDKMMTLVASALAGGDCIDDADVLRTGGTACTLGSVVKAPSTLGTFLRSFQCGHERDVPRPLDYPKLMSIPITVGRLKSGYPARTAGQRATETTG